MPALGGAVSMLLVIFDIWLWTNYPKPIPEPVALQVSAFLGAWLVACLAILLFVASLTHCFMTDKEDAQTPRT